MIAYFSCLLIRQRLKPIKLNVKRINFSQGLLNSYLVEQKGFGAHSLYQSWINVDCTKPVVLVLHSWGDHWIVISNIECGKGKINIYNRVL